MVNLKVVQWLFLALTVTTLFLVGLGAYVRATGAGLACPDWPLCFGQVVPDFSIAGVSQEVWHRYIASFVGLLSIALVLASYLRRAQQPRLFRFSVALLVLVIVQGVFGGLTVTMKLHPHIVVTHLALGTIFLQAVMLGFVQTAKYRKGKALFAPSPYRPLVLLATVLTFLQIIWGGFVAASGASLVCSDFPSCNGFLLPRLGELGLGHPESVQLIHRLLGYSVFLLFLALVVLARRGAPGLVEKKGHITGVMGLVLFQILLGVGAIHMRVPPSMSVAHLVVAELIMFGILMLYSGMERRTTIYPK